MADTNHAINLIFAISNILAQIFIWYAFYVFSDILRIIDHNHKTKTGRELLLIVLPLLLIQPVISGYFFYETEAFPPPDMSLFIFAVFFIAHLLILITILHFKNKMDLPIKHKNIIYAYILLYFTINMYAVLGLTAYNLIPQFLYLAGKLFLAVSLLIIFEYTAHTFKELAVISRLFFISALLIFTTPLLRVYALYNANSQEIMIFARAINLTVNLAVGIIMLIGMLVFRNLIINFYAIKDGLAKKKKYI